ncbi:MAG: hypothetical protein RL708_23 [Bacteroidota bacterium]|jgi:lycopene cyclase domain-containing protein
MLPEKYYYLIIDVASFAFPFLFSFHPQIKFYKKWKYYLPSMLLTAFLFIVWDEWFTRMNVWGFNPKYLLGIYVGHLPLEEILFFVFIPYCLSFMFHCLPLGIKINEQNSWIKYLNWVIAIFIFIVGIISIHQWYTGFTCIATSIFLSTILLLDKKNIFPWKQFWLTYLLGLIPFFIVNGLLTSLPIVTYNNAENLGIRINTIPVEDSVYNLLLFLCNIVGMMVLKRKFAK